MGQKNKGNKYGAGFAAGFVMILAQATPLSAETVVSGLTYGAYMDFDNNSPKSDGYLFGTYLNITKDLTDSFEFGYDRTTLDFGTAGDLDQNDLTVKYTRFFEGGDVKIGMHGTISEDDTLASDGYVFILGMDRFKAYDFAYGIDLFGSKYGDIAFDTTTNRQSVKAFQASPYYGKYFPTALGEGWYLQGKVDLTQIDSTNQDDFLVAGEGLVTWYSGAYSLTAKGFIGERQFFVDSGGFTTYNLADVYKGGVTVEAKYTFSSAMSLKAAYNWNTREINSLDSDSNIYSLSLGMKF